MENKSLLNEQLKNAQSAKDGKYLTFVLGNEEYGLEILKVREIIGMMDITSVPQTPKFVKGVINLRGKVIPIVDLRLKFSMPEAKYTKETCIIVVDIKGIFVGIVVDTVKEVLDIKEEDIEEMRALGSTVNTDFMLGMAKVKGAVKILLDIEKVLDASQFELIKKI